MGEIPKDVTRTARDVAFDFDCDWTADGRRWGQVEEDAAVHAIARAILAERERCARIAVEQGQKTADEMLSASIYPRGSGEPVHVMLEKRASGARDAGLEIAAAIRKGD